VLTSRTFHRKSRIEQLLSLRTGPPGIVVRVSMLPYGPPCSLPQVVSLMIQSVASRRMTELAGYLTLLLANDVIRDDPGFLEFLGKRWVNWVGLESLPRGLVASESSRDPY
jgi:hypothetical protein